MRAYAVFVLLFSYVSSVTVNKLTHNIVADTKEQLPSIHIPCSLNDIIILSAPIVNHNITFFELTSPNGHTRSLNITLTKTALKPDFHENSVVIKYTKGRHKVITLRDNYNLFNLNAGQLKDVNNTVFEDHERRMRPNEFMVGPVSEDDHGNWVLSLFAEEYGNVLEFFQVISIEIQEMLPPKERTKTLKTGDTFRFGFAYPIPNLESCQFTAPQTTYDRWYDRDQDNLDSCMFVVTNVTKDDEGIWKVVGVGRIVYVTMSFLNVN